jgi:Tfp pilus assembly protein PilE
MKTALHNRKGLQSLEVSVGLLIITALAAIILFSLSSYAAKAKAEGSRAETSLILTATRLYVAEEGIRATTLDDAESLDPLAASVSTLIDDTIYGPGADEDAQVIERVTINAQGTVTELGYVSSTGQTVLFDGEVFNVY